MLLDQRAPSIGFNWRVHIFAWIVATPGEKLGVSRTCCFVCTSDRRDMHAVHDRRLETGENTFPVLDIIDTIQQIAKL